MTPYLIALAVALSLLLILQRQRNNVRLAHLTDALRSHDRSKVGNLDSATAPSAFRELERQIFEQLFEAEALEKRVTRREHLLGAVVEGLGDAVIVFDDKMVIRFTNASAARLFDWKEPPLGKRAADCISNFELLDMFESAVVHDRRESAELRHHMEGDRSAEPRTFEVDIAPLLHSDAHSVTRARAILHDISEARHLEQVRKDFVANASHELRTPLTIINGYIENLIDGGIDDRAMALRFLGVMQKHGHRIARIIEDMLTISKLESHAETLQREPFDLQGCADEVIARLNPVIEEKGAVMVCEFPDDSHIAGDAFYWDQILFNLIENALKENDARGLQIRIALERGDRADRISVCDDGVGIPKAALQFIFKRFYQVDSNRSAEKKGTGLGLSIVKRAVEAHGGSIEVESIPGERTIFVMEIPHAGNPHSTAADEREHDEPAAESQRQRAEN